jgi:hypothetical protein
MELTSIGQEQMEVHLRLVPGGEEKGLGLVTPMMVTTAGRAGCPYPRSQGGGCPFAGEVRLNHRPLLSPISFFAPVYFQFSN